MRICQSQTEQKPRGLACLQFWHTMRQHVFCAFVAALAADVQPVAAERVEELAEHRAEHACEEGSHHCEHCGTWRRTCPAPAAACCPSKG